MKRDPVERVRTKLKDTFGDHLREQWNELIDDDLDLARLHGWASEAPGDRAERPAVLHS